MSRRPADPAARVVAHSRPHCSVDLQHWSRFLEGELRSAECRRCEAHLEVCAECRARLKGVRQTIRACQSFARTPLPQPLRARARTRARTIVSPRAKDGAK